MRCYICIREHCCSFLCWSVSSQARMYYAEGQLDKAFILYNKFVT